MKKCRPHMSDAASPPLQMHHTGAGSGAENKPRGLTTQKNGVRKSNYVNSKVLIDNSASLCLGPIHHSALPQEEKDAHVTSADAGKCHTSSSEALEQTPTDLTSLALSERPVRREREKKTDCSSSALNVAWTLWNGQPCAFKLSNCPSECVHVDDGLDALPHSLFNCFTLRPFDSRKSFATLQNKLCRLLNHSGSWSTAPCCL